MSAQAVSHAASVRAFGADVLMAGGIIIGIPMVILAVGIPIALVVQLLLWIARSI